MALTKMIYQNIFHDVNGNEKWTAAGTSDLFRNTNNANDLNVEFSGTAIFTAHIEGRMSHNNTGSWFNMATVGLNDLKVKTSITSTGIYALSISGMAEIRVIIDTLTSGELTITGGIGD